MVCFTRQSDSTHFLLLLLLFTRDIVAQSVPVSSFSLGTYGHSRRLGKRQTVWPEYKLRIIFFLSYRGTRVQDWFSRADDICGAFYGARIEGEREGGDVCGWSWLFLRLLVDAGSELERGGECGGLFLPGLGGGEGASVRVCRAGGLPLLWLILQVLCGEFDAAVEGHCSGARWWASRERRAACCYSTDNRRHTSIINLLCRNPVYPHHAKATRHVWPWQRSVRHGANNQRPKPNCWVS